MIKELYEQWKKIKSEHEEICNTILEYFSSKKYKREIHTQLLDKMEELLQRMRKIESAICTILDGRIYQIENGKFITVDDGLRIVEEYKDDQTTV